MDLMKKKKKKKKKKKHAMGSQRALIVISCPYECVLEDRDIAMRSRLMGERRTSIYLPSKPGA